MSSDVAPRRGLLRLGLSVAAIGFVWCIALPYIGTLKPVRQHVDFLDARDIDASAMFYTELDAMDPILDHLESR